MDVKAQLLDVQKIWDRAPHNALTDLIRYHDLWFCVFREGEDHVSPEGKIRIIVSSEGDLWSAGTLLSISDVDLRDPKITLAPSGLLMLTAAGAYHPSASCRHQSFAWFSENGMDWGSPEKIGDPNFWIWRVTWKGDVAYGVAYSTVEPLGTRLYSSTDGIQYRVVVDKLFIEDFPNEAAIVFQNDATALCLLRRDSGTATAMLGRADPGYTRWDWNDLGVRIGGPNMLVLPDGRIIAAIRRYGKQPWTSLNWLDPVNCSLVEFMALPSGGDTSYAGLQWHRGVLWASYYSSHEQRTSIYLAKIKI